MRVNDFEKTMKKKPLISVISPVYGAQGIVHNLVNQIENSLQEITEEYEVLLIEDNSPDRSWSEILKVAANNKKVKGIKLSRNFGQHNAISAGMEIAIGDYVVVMDCDLQHNPIYIKEMYKQIQNGNDIVYTRTKTRKHNVIKNIFALLYYKLLNLISDFNMDPNIGNFSMLSRRVVAAFNQYNDYKKAYLWVLSWIGFKYTVLDIEHNERPLGKSSYNLKKIIIHALNVTIANSNKLLYISIYLGIIVSISSLIGGLYLIYNYYSNGALEGWTSLLVIIMFLSGLILITIGITAIYIAKIYEQTKGRPRYLVSEKINC